MLRQCPIIMTSAQFNYRVQKSKKRKGLYLWMVLNHKEEGNATQSSDIGKQINVEVVFKVNR